MKTLSSLLLILIACVNALSKEENHKYRVGKEPSNKEYFENEKYNPNYEAFLDEEADTFDELPPEENKRLLGVVFDKIDTNIDGFISREELKNWIIFTQKSHISEDVTWIWKQQNPEEKLTISWEEYKQQMYGFLDHDREKGKPYRSVIKKDRRRWAAADQDGDGNLTKKDFAAFLHPGNTDHMKNILVLETVENIDKDGDGKISVNEYIDNMCRIEDGDELNWVKSITEEFNIYRDKNGDGFMDEHEVKQWILPDDFDDAHADVNYLFYEADSDANEQLTKDEVLKKYYLFLRSQTTDFVESFERHDDF